MPASLTTIAWLLLGYQTYSHLTGYRDPIQHLDPSPGMGPYALQE